jgi:segregation and condensation protein A
MENDQSNSPAESPEVESQQNGISWDLPEDLEYFKTSEAYRIELPDYQGPLDLLLFLIDKDELDIYDIPISRITDQYLKYLDIIQQLSLDNAGEFLVMAATLIKIKSSLLLPVQPTDEDSDEEDPRAELVRRLLEYRRYKDMASNLSDMEKDRSLLHTRDSRYPFLGENREAPQLKLGMFDLLLALSDVYERVTSEAVHTVHRVVYTVEEKVKLIHARLCKSRTLRFDELFDEDTIKMEVVVTFMAILELTRQQLISLMQTEPMGMIWVKVRENGSSAAWLAREDLDDVDSETPEILEEEG